MRRGVDEPPCGPVEDAFELLDLAALNIGERRLDPPGGVRLLVLNSVDEIPLSGREPFCDVVECAAPVGRVRLQLGRCGGRRFLRRLRQVIAQLGHGRPLLLVGGLQPPCVVVEPSFERS